MASHGQSRFHQGGKFVEEAPTRRSPSLFQQDAQPLPVQFLLFDNGRKQCTGHGSVFITMAGVLNFDS